MALSRISQEQVIQCSRGLAPYAGDKQLNLISQSDVSGVRIVH